MLKRKKKIPAPSLASYPLLINCPGLFRLENESAFGEGDIQLGCPSELSLRFWGQSWGTEAGTYTTWHTCTAAACAHLTACSAGERRLLFMFSS